MTARSSEGRWPEDAAGGGRDDLPVFDITVANPARIWDYWLGGHFL